MLLHEILFVIGADLSLPSLLHLLLVFIRTLLTDELDARSHHLIVSFSEQDVFEEERPYVVVASVSVKVPTESYLLLYKLQFDYYSYVYKLLYRFKVFDSSSF